MIGVQLDLVDEHPDLPIDRFPRGEHGGQALSPLPPNGPGAGAAMDAAGPRRGHGTRRSS